MFFTSCFQNAIHLWKSFGCRARTNSLCRELSFPCVRAFFGTERVVERPLQAPGGTCPGLVSVQERGIICVPLWFASASTPVLRRLTRMAAACRINAIAAPVRPTCERILRRNPGNRPSIDAALRHSTKNKSWGLVWITLANFHNLNGIPPPRRVQAGPRHRA